jgi:hypothetical protein
MHGTHLQALGFHGSGFENGISLLGGNAIVDPWPDKDSNERLCALLIQSNLLKFSGQYRSVISKKKC